MPAELARPLTILQMFLTLHSRTLSMPDQHPAHLKASLRARSEPLPLL